MILYKFEDYWLNYEWRRNELIETLFERKEEGKKEKEKSVCEIVK